CRDGEIPRSAQLQLFAAVEVKAYRLGVRFGSDNEVIFKLLLIAIVDQVNTGIDASVANLRVGGYTAMPLGRIVADEIVDRAGKLVVAGRPKARVCPSQFHADEVSYWGFDIGGRSCRRRVRASRRGGLHELEHGGRIREEDRIAATSSLKA